MTGNNCPALSSEVLSSLEDFNPNSSVLFGSAENTLITKGVYSRITTPAMDCKKSSRSLTEQIFDLFRKAKTDGIERPIVVGSIPFDCHQESNLIIPEKSRWTKLEAFQIQAATARCESLPHSTFDRAAYEQSVALLLEKFKTQSLQKVVLSRKLDIPMTGNADYLGMIGRILKTSGTNYRFSIPINDTDILIGSSPELLVCKKAQEVMSNPLAGSINRYKFVEDDQAVSFLLQSKKDRHEHKLVVDQVRDVLESYCKTLEVPSPTALPTATLWHLSTVLKGVLKRPETDALELALALHPTPAVCGYPTAAAKKAIAEVERFNRGLFTGISGWMDAEGNGEWAVTIRCGIVSPTGVSIFAGAGIVEGSVPELEWAETNAKMVPMFETLAPFHGER